MAAGFAFVKHEISAPLKIILGRGHPPSSFLVFEPPLLRALGERESCKQIATLNPRCRSCQAAGFIVFTRLAEMCGIRGRRAPRRGPAGAAASAGETPPPGAATAQPGPPPAPAWALPLCTWLLFTFNQMGRERRERSLWPPSSDHKYCRKLQMAAPLPNSAHTASPNALEMRRE